MGVEGVLTGQEKDQVGGVKNVVALMRAKIGVQLH